MVDFKQIDMGELGRHLFAKILKATASDGTFQEIYEECKARNQPYEDEAFPPTEFSLISDWEDPEVQDKVRLWRTFEWVRATQIPSLNDEEGKLQVFFNEVSPDDIKQGLLGDCYFLSVLSVLSEKPQRIKNLFVHDKQNNLGVYGLRICKNGEWKEVVVDDYIPCWKDDPAFTKAKGNELWVILLEKAWAKLHGSYERIEAGFAENVLRDLTGAPTEVIETSDETLWDRVKFADQQNWIMAASAGSTSASVEALEKLGLIGNHSYGLLGCVEITDQFGDTVRLFQLRNPWGDFEWKGDWGDDSDCWTAQSKQQAGWTDADDGTFFMCEEDLLKYFSRIQLCRINDNYQYSFFKARHKLNSFSLIRFQVNAPGGHCYLTVNQTDDRCFDRHVDYDYSNVRLIVAMIEDPDAEEKKLIYCNGKQGMDRDIWEEYEDLAPGEYYMFVEFDWPDNVQHTEFSVSCYGKSKAIFLRDEKSLYNKDDLVRELMASCGEQELAPEGKVTNFAEQGAPGITKYFAMTEEGYGYVHIVNNEQEAKYRENINYTKFDKLELQKPFKGTSYDIEVLPGQKKTVVFRQMDPTGFAMASQIMMSAVLHGPEKLKQLCKEKGKKTQRLHTKTKAPFEIYQYQYKHQSGIAYFYENLTSGNTLQEKLQFQLSGLTIEGNEEGNNIVEFRLGPGQTKFIELKAIGGMQWKIGCGMAYGIM